MFSFSRRSLNLIMNFNPVVLTWLSFIQRPNKHLQKRRRTYRHLSLILLLTVAVNLVLPSAFSAARIYCGQVHPFHAVEGSHATPDCCNQAQSDGPHTGYNHSSCSMGQICEQSRTDKLKDTPVVRTQQLQIAGASIPVVEFIDPVRRPTGTFTSIKTTKVSIVRDIHIHNSTFLN